MFGREWLYNTVLRDFRVGIKIYFLRFYFDRNAVDLVLEWDSSEFKGRNKKGNFERFGGAERVVE